MSKKKTAALVEARVARERQWAYDRWLERLTWAQMRVLAQLPPERGGLGYDLSPSALKGLVTQARADMGDTAMSRDERIERQTAELDAIARSLRKRIAAADEMGGVDVHATKLLLETQKREEILHGLAAATQVEATVVHKEAIVEELNEMLARAGRKPIEVE